MQTDFDDYDDLEEGGFNWMLVTVLLLAIAGFFSLAWYAYQTGGKAVNQGEVIVIKADPAPVKEKPEDEGGMEFPHQEKTIYNALKPEGEENVVVSIIPPAEEPEIAEPETPESADTKVAQIIQQAVEDMQQKQQQQQPEAKVNEAISEPEPAPAKPPVEPAQKEEKLEEAAAPVKELAKATPDPVVAGAGSRIQLGAFQSSLEAEKMWQKIQRANKDVLEGKPHQVVRADLGDKGVFYRLRAAGFANDAAANEVCKTLSARKQGCFVVR